MVINDNYHLHKSSKAPVTSVVTKKKSIFDLSDKDFEEMPVEGIDWDQLSNEEKDHIRSWSAKKTEELSRLVEDAQNECCVMPLGMDRTYRTYWFLKSAPGRWCDGCCFCVIVMVLVCLSCKYGFWKYFFIVVGVL